MELEREGNCPKVDVGETGRDDSDVRGGAGACFGRGRITGLSEGSTELRSGDFVHESRLGCEDDDDDDDGSAERMTGTGGTGGSNGVGDVLLMPESCVRLEPMDDVRGRETELRGSGEVGRLWSLSTYAGGTGASGRRLGVRMRTLREGLTAAVVCLDVLADGVGEGVRIGEV